jgi:hypothetical protein
VRWNWKLTSGVELAYFPRLCGAASGGTASTPNCRGYQVSPSDPLHVKDPIETLWKPY